MNRNLSNCEIARKKKGFFSGPQRDSNPWPVRSRCSALPAELWIPIYWRQANLLSSSTREKNEIQNLYCSFWQHQERIVGILQHSPPWGRLLQWIRQKLKPTWSLQGPTSLLGLMVPWERTLQHGVVLHGRTTSVHLSGVRESRVGQVNLELSARPTKMRWNKYDKRRQFDRLNWFSQLGP